MNERPLRLRRIEDDLVICGRLTLGMSFWQRFRGLMGRASMPDDEGLYLPGNSIHMMFMRFPIDAMFVSKADAEGKRTVVSMRPDLPTWRGLVWPQRGAEGVVEMRAGTLARCDVAIDETVVFEPGAVEADETADEVRAKSEVDAD